MTPFDRRLPADASFERVAELLAELNADDAVSGVLLQFEGAPFLQSERALFTSETLGRSTVCIPIGGWAADAAENPGRTTE